VHVVCCIAIGTAEIVVLAEEYARDNPVSTEQSAALALSFSTGKKHF